MKNVTIDFSIRNCIIEILRGLQMPTNYRVLLESSAKHNEVAIVFERKTGFYFKFNGKKYYIPFASWWVPERTITEYCYEDLLEKICKYPMLLETTVVIENNKVLPFRYSTVVVKQEDKAVEA
jgi:hypothetical protein